MEKTLEQLRAEADAARVALEAAQAAEQKRAREIREAALEAERKAKEESKYNANKVHADRIVEELKKVGFTSAEVRKPEGDWHLDRPVIFVEDGYASWTNIEFEGDGSYRNEKLIIKVGGYGGTAYPIRKDGTYNYEKIAARAKEYKDQRIAEQTAAQKEANRQKANAELVVKLCKEFNILEDGWFSPIVKADKWGENMVTVSFSKAELNEDKAREVLTVLRNAGLI